MNYNIWLHILEGIEGTLRTEDKTSFCKWKENKPSGANHLQRSLELTCKCVSANNDNEIVHYGCDYVGEPHTKQVNLYMSYNSGNQVKFYKDIAQFAASMIMT